jgi:uncharacterized protein (TIGR02452 family)
MANRSARGRVARETVEILDAGCYLDPSGERVDISPSLARCVSGTVVYGESQGELDLRCRDILDRRRSGFDAQFEVVNETTLGAARRLVERGEGDVAALNFASAKHPGGGFLGGSQAQEESLARASGLYASLAPCREHYETNLLCGTALYTDSIVYSPRVPVFRDDDDQLIAPPYEVSFITSPAVNAGAVLKNRPHEASKIEGVMRSRMQKVLTVAVAHGHEVLILGAWGCGVFRNRPGDVADWFASNLKPGGRFARAFRRVVFAVLDYSNDEEFIGPFFTAFGTKHVG